MSAGMQIAWVDPTTPTAVVVALPLGASLTVAVGETWYLMPPNAVGASPPINTVRVTSFVFTPVPGCTHANCCKPAPKLVLNLTVTGVTARDRKSVV